MNAVAIQQDTENLLLYLSMTNFDSARTLESLRNLCPDETTTEEVLSTLIDIGYVYVEGDAFDLTLDGLQAALQIQGTSKAKAMPAKHTVLPFRTAQPPLPTIEAHPLRTGIERTKNEAVGERPLLRYLLAFASYESALPVPVIDGDILGRGSDSHICLSQDEFISGQHCRFRIERKNLALAVEDLGSRNGTFVNEIPLEMGRWCYLAHGSSLRVGSTVLRVVQIPD